jgi:hypothetical protein
VVDVTTITAASTIDIVIADGDPVPAEVLHLSPSGTFAVVKLTGTPHKGTVDVFHVGTGKRATPIRHFPVVRTKTIAIALADALDEFNPVEADGTLRVAREEYHRRVDEIVRALTAR